MQHLGIGFAVCCFSVLLTACKPERTGRADDPIVQQKVLQATEAPSNDPLAEFRIPLSYSAAKQLLAVQLPLSQMTAQQVHEKMLERKDSDLPEALSLANDLVTGFQGAPGTGHKTDAEIGGYRQGALQLLTEHLCPEQGFTDAHGLTLPDPQTFYEKLKSAINSGSAETLEPFVFDHLNVGYNPDEPSNLHGHKLNLTPSDISHALVGVHSQLDWESVEHKANNHYAEWTIPAMNVGISYSFKFSYIPAYQGWRWGSLLTNDPAFVRLVATYRRSVAASWKLDCMPFGDLHNGNWQSEGGVFAYFDGKSVGVYDPDTGNDSSIVDFETDSNITKFWDQDFRRLYLASGNGVFAVDWKTNSSLEQLSGAPDELQSFHDAWIDDSTGKLRLLGIRKYSTEESPTEVSPGRVWEYEGTAAGWKSIGDTPIDCNEIGQCRYPGLDGLRSAKGIRLWSDECFDLHQPLPANSTLEPQNITWNRAILLKPPTQNGLSVIATAMRKGRSLVEAGVPFYVISREGQSWSVDFNAVSDKALVFPLLYPGDRLLIITAWDTSSEGGQCGFSVESRELFDLATGKKISHYEDSGHGAVHFVPRPVGF